MTGTWKTEKFPSFEQALHKLIEQHRELKDEPLRLAISYQPARAPQDIFLFEMIGNPGNESISAERELFETTFAPTPGFPMDFNQRLHLILTNPQEFETALRDHWSSMDEILNAVQEGDYQVLFADKVGKRFLKRIQAEKHNGSATNRG